MSETPQTDGSYPDEMRNLEGGLSVISYLQEMLTRQSAVGPQEAQHLSNAYQWLTSLRERHEQEIAKHKA